MLHKVALFFDLVLIIFELIQLQSLSQVKKLQKINVQQDVLKKAFS